jgi:hypothetical protein
MVVLVAASAGLSWVGAVALALLEALAAPVPAARPSEGGVVVLM